VTVPVIPSNHSLPSLSSVPSGLRVHTHGLRRDSQTYFVLG
jgi:hypothetical protein